MGKSKELATLTDQGFETSKPIKVGKEGITNAYGDASGYVADFQADTGNQTYISIAEPNAPSTGDNGLILGEDTSGSYLYQRQSKPMYFGTNNLTRMTIDASGRVTMPYQPMFQVENTSGWSHPSGTVLAPYSTAINNVGGHYNTSTYRFTAPIGGTYIFNAWWGTGGSWGAHSYLGMRFRINNLDHRTGWEHNSTIGYARDDAVIIVKLNANDFVEAYLESAISGSLSGGAGINGFQGCLLG